MPPGQGYPQLSFSGRRRGVGNQGLAPFTYAVAQQRALDEQRQQQDFNNQIRMQQHQQSQEYNNERLVQMREDAEQRARALKLAEQRRKRLDASTAKSAVELKKLGYSSPEQLQAAQSDMGMRRSEQIFDQTKVAGERVAAEDQRMVAKRDRERAVLDDMASEMDEADRDSFLALGQASGLPAALKWREDRKGESEQAANIEALASVFDEVEGGRGKHIADALRKGLDISKIPGQVVSNLLAPSASRTSASRAGRLSFKDAYDRALDGLGIDPELTGISNDDLLNKVIPRARALMREADGPDAQASPRPPVDPGKEEEDKLKKLEEQRAALRKQGGSSEQVEALMTDLDSPTFDWIVQQGTYEDIVVEEGDVSEVDSEGKKIYVATINGRPYQAQQGADGGWFVSRPIEDVKQLEKARNKILKEKRNYVALYVKESPGNALQKFAKANQMWDQSMAAVDAHLAIRKGLEARNLAATDLLMSPVGSLLSEEQLNAFSLDDYVESVDRMEVPISSGSKETASVGRTRHQVEAQMRKNQDKIVAHIQAKYMPNFDEKFFDKVVGGGTIPKSEAVRLYKNIYRRVRDLTLGDIEAWDDFEVGGMGQPFSETPFSMRSRRMERILKSVRTRHPNWSEEKVKSEVARRSGKTAWEGSPFQSWAGSLDEPAWRDKLISKFGAFGGYLLGQPFPPSRPHATLEKRGNKRVKAGEKYWGPLTPAIGSPPK